MRGLGEGTSCISSVCSMNLRSHLAKWSWNIRSGRRLLCIDPNCLGAGRNLFIFCSATGWEPSSWGARQAVTPQVSLLCSCCLHTDAFLLLDGSHGQSTASYGCSPPNPRCYWMRSPFHYDQGPNIYHLLMMRLIPMVIQLHFPSSCQDWSPFLSVITCPNIARS